MILPGMLSKSGRNSAGRTSLYRSLATLIFVKDDLSPQLIGTAFIIQADGSSAIAFSAAHCFDEIRKQLHPHARHHVSALPEFLPPPSELDLARVKAVYKKDQRIKSCDLEIAIWDSESDFAALVLKAPASDSTLFQDMFWVDATIPAVGEECVMIGFGDMKVTMNTDNSNSGQIRRRLELRIGRVEADRQRSWSVAIPVRRDDSGGVVARWQMDAPIKPFAIISNAPGATTLRRSIAFRSFNRSNCAHVDEAARRRETGARNCRKKHRPWPAAKMIDRSADHVASRCRIGSAL